jgi:hypothetical protein
MYFARVRLSGLKNDGSRTASGSTGRKRSFALKSRSSRSAPGSAR